MATHSEGSPLECTATGATAITARADASESRSQRPQTRFDRRARSAVVPCTALGARCVLPCSLSSDSPTLPPSTRCHCALLLTSAARSLRFHDSRAAESERPLTTALLPAVLTQPDSHSTNSPLHE